jgi:hypothetical protein
VSVRRNSFGIQIRAHQVQGVSRVLDRKRKQLLRRIAGQEPQLLEVDITASKLVSSHPDSARVGSARSPATISMLHVDADKTAKAKATRSMLSYWFGAKLDTFPIPTHSLPRRS